MSHNDLRRSLQGLRALHQRLPKKLITMEETPNGQGVTLATFSATGNCTGCALCPSQAGRSLHRQFVAGDLRC